MPLENDDLEFISGKLPSVEGWLLDDSSYLTCDLVRMQAENKIAGGIFEIGVYAGKYLSLLYHLTQRTGERVVGLDTFGWYPRAKVEENFKRVFGVADRLSLITSDSMKVTAADLLGSLGGKPRFISVDGAHTSPAVLNDMKLSEEILAEGGIVAIDDVFNHRAIGVSEGAYRYFIGRDGKGLVPFAYCANKMYAAHHRDAGRMQKAVWQFTKANPNLSVNVEFGKLAEKGRNWVEQELFGVPVVIL